MRSLLDKANIKRRIQRLKEQLQPYEEHDKPSEYYSYHGGESVGRLYGQIMILEELLDELEEYNNE